MISIRVPEPNGVGVWRKLPAGKLHATFQSPQVEIATASILRPRFQEARRRWR